MVAIGEYPAQGTIPITENEYAKLYEPAESFTDYIPWLDYDPEAQVFEMDDHISVGGMWELQPVDVDGKPTETIENIEKNLVRALHTLPQEEDRPWICQMFLQDEPIDPKKQVEFFRNYARSYARDTEHAKAWFEALEEHYTQLRRGVFKDPLTAIPWKAKTRKIRLLIYKKFERTDYYDSKNNPLPGTLSPSEELNNAVHPFVRMLSQNRINATRIGGKEMYDWMVPWLSPKPSGYDSAYDYLVDRPYPDENDRAIAFDLAAAVTTDSPHTMKDGSEMNGVFVFCNQPQRFISLAAIDSPPTPGLITTDRNEAGTIKPALWDQMPENSIYSLTITVKPKHQIEQHINRLLARTGGGSYDEGVSIEQANDAQKAMARGRRIYSMFAGVYVRSTNMKSHIKDTMDALTVMRSAGLNPTDPSSDPIAKDCFIRALPYCYDVEHDTQHAARSRLTYDTHITRIMPLLGRGTGTGNPGNVFFNRVGENLMFDPFNPLDKKKSSHGVIFGPTGSGKSAFLTYCGLHSMAMRKPRQFYIEKGASFELLARWFRYKGLSVKQYKFTPRADISLPPYAMMDKALKQIEEQENVDPATLNMMESDHIDEDQEWAGDDYEDDQRDYLGEMELLTQMMITGADEKTNESMTQQDRRIIQQSIIAALKNARENKKPHPLVEDICTELGVLYGKEELIERKNRIREMQESLELWTESLRGKFFNRLGSAWPECDATIFDMGILTQDQNSDMLAVAMVSLVNTITGLGEKYQFEERETEVVIDEGHIISKNPMLVKPFVFGVKTWRKLSISLQNASQNLDDYPDKAKSMLNLAEWWYCLVMPKEEIEEISRFRALNDEQKMLLQTANKESKKYTEGVVMSDDMNSLFRVVMPGLALGLAGTDGDEKMERKKIVDEMGYEGPDAMLMAGIEVGRRITSARSGVLS